MTKIEGVIDENDSCCYACGWAILDNCKIKLKSGKLIIYGEGLKLMHDSALEVSENAEIEFRSI